jgi:hypothetical protein
MADKQAICVMLQIEHEDRRLTPERIEEAMKTADGVSALRRVVLQHLPRDVTRLIAVFPVEQARLLMMLHEAVGEDIAAHLGVPADEVAPMRPPPGYKPPP